MKKNLALKHTMLTIMKITISQCLLCAIFSVMALGTPTRAQQILTREVSIKLTNVSLKTVLVEIEKQSGVRFVYSNNTIQLNKDVSIEVNHEALHSVLPKLLFPNQIRYEVVEEQIILKKNKEHYYPQ